VHARLALISLSFLEFGYQPPHFPQESAKIQLRELVVPVASCSLEHQRHRTLVHDSKLRSLIRTRTNLLSRHSLVSPSMSTSQNVIAPRDAVIKATDY